MVYFEARKSRDLYMWLSRSPQGPSAKFQVLNVSAYLSVSLSICKFNHDKYMTHYHSMFLNVIFEKFI